MSIHSAVLPIELSEDLHNLLCQLNWLNESMKSDKTNSVISALLLSMDNENKEYISELLETVSRINLSDGVIKDTINLIEQES